MLTRCQPDSEPLPEVEIADLRDEEIFPHFSHLPRHGSFPRKYYVDGFEELPQKHWCLLAEIIRIEDDPIRVSIIVRDKSGEEMRASFYTEDYGREFEDQLRPGSTIAVLYPHKFPLADNRNHMVFGLRVTKRKLIRVSHYPFPFDINLD